MTATTVTAEVVEPAPNPEEVQKHKQVEGEAATVETIDTTPPVQESLENEEAKSEPANEMEPTTGEVLTEETGIQW